MDASALAGASFFSAACLRQSSIFILANLSVDKKGVKAWQRAAVLAMLVRSGVRAELM